MFGKKNSQQAAPIKRSICNQRPKGLGGPICSRKVKRGWDTCGRPDCATWKYAAEAA
jgi:hypothetical protein